MRFRGEVVIITGASKGIGKALALEFAKHRANVIITSRSLIKVKQIKDENPSLPLHPFECDITSKKSVNSLINSAIKKFGKIDIFINNAGIAFFETIKNSKETDIKKTFETHFFGPVYAIQVVLPHMRKRKKGIIVNISSAISKYSLYDQGIYSASKAALERITQALDLEEHSNRIKTLCVFPDRTRTTINKHPLGNKQLSKLPFKSKENSAKNVAKHIIKCIQKGNRNCYPTWKSRLFAIAAGVSPWIIRRSFLKIYLKQKQ